MADYHPPNIEHPEQVSCADPVIHKGPFATVYFGPGAVEKLDAIVIGLGAKRPAIVCTPSRAADGEAIIAQLSMGGVLMADAVMHTPVEVSERAAEQAVREGADLLISTGGGSSSGLGKALTRRLGLRHVALPRTYSGSELTPFLGERRNGDKRTVRDDKFRPVAIIYDPDLTVNLPAHVSAASGMNAMAHAVGGSYIFSEIKPKLAELTRPQVVALSQTLGQTVYFGVLENDMVTYLVKTELGKEPLFTQEGGQLEAYCPSIGKVLLSNLPSEQIDDYLASGPFPSLTAKTITDPAEIRLELENARAHNYAVDDAEVDDRLFCLAVPVKDASGEVLGALSLSSHDPNVLGGDKSQCLDALRGGAQSVTRVLSAELSVGYV